MRRYRFQDAPENELIGKNHQVFPVTSPSAGNQQGFQTGCPTTATDGLAPRFFARSLNAFPILFQQFLQRETDVPTNRQGREIEDRRQFGIRSGQDAGPDA